MGLLDKLKGKGKGTRPSPCAQLLPFSSNQSQPTNTIPLGQDSVYRYRKQRGVNLGSWFVLEKWITPAPFARAAQPGESDLDIARGADAKEAFEHHWDTFMTEDNWQWIKDHGFNSVRLPVSETFGRTPSRDAETSLDCILPPLLCHSGRSQGDRLPGSQRYI